MNRINVEEAMSFEPPPLLIDKFCLEHKVSPDDARARFQETKKFLVLCASDRRKHYSPSVAVDAMWHQFILHSRDYFMFCELVGGYVHHQPSEKLETKETADTLAALRRKFEEIDEHYWEQQSASCCSGCSN